MGCVHKATTGGASPHPGANLFIVSLFAFMFFLVLFYFLLLRCSWCCLLFLKIQYPYSRTRTTTNRPIHTILLHLTPTIVDNKSWKSFIVVADADDFLFSFASINLHIKLRMYNMLSYILLRGVCANHSCFAPLYLRFIFATFPILYFHLASFSDEREFVKLTENNMLLIQQPIE